jgi:5-formyltetrahydrofolate cyclo-ligase
VTAPTARAAPHALSDLDRAKQQARRLARAAREGCDPSVGTQLAAHVLAGLPLPAGVAVSGFWPMPGEIDIRPLLAALHASGHPVLLPETPPLGNPLIFRRWQPGAEMVRERFGTFRPTGEICTPAVLFVPLLAFDRAGHRLGYGGGYYDRTITGLPGARTIGCAFAAQEIEAVPVGEHDVLLDAVATERGVIRFRHF